MKLLHIGALVDDHVHDAVLVTPEHAKRLDKPDGDYVLWTSPVDSSYGWSEWVEDEKWYSGWASGPPRWDLVLSAEARVLRIDSVLDLQELAGLYPVAPERNVIAKMALEYAVMARVVVDWPAVARDYDAVWLTAAGQEVTRFSEPSLYGWDCETVVIFRASAVCEVVER